MTSFEAEEAYDEGYEAGYDEGVDDGYEEGFRAGAETTERAYEPDFETQEFNRGCESALREVLAMVNVWGDVAAVRSGIMEMLEAMKVFTFTLCLPGEPTITAELLERLSRSGCDDAFVETKDSKVYLTFTRVAVCHEAAFSDAKLELEKVGLDTCRG